MRSDVSSWFALILCRLRGMMRELQHLCKQKELPTLVEEFNRWATRARRLTQATSGFPLLAEVADGEMATIIKQWVCRSLLCL